MLILLLYFETGVYQVEYQTENYFFFTDYMQLFKL